jgi:hypothetical protein
MINSIAVPRAPTDWGLSLQVEMAGTVFPDVKIPFFHVASKLNGF